MPIDKKARLDFNNNLEKTTDLIFSASIKPSAAGHWLPINAGRMSDIGAHYRNMMLNNSFEVSFMMSNMDSVGSWNVSDLLVSSLKVQNDRCNPNPCQNKAQCHSLSGDFYCSCPDHYEGKTCSELKDHCKTNQCKGNKTTSRSVSLEEVPSNSVAAMLNLAP